eukprot:TRINITY_DN32730_c0_g1_i1.p2 TRINITY_DN32730_c0_g1~~TRINITY_DN32730_c0_g1_i1.p2  ORF type:complete len:204 (+),score=57.85 TRINITY_DN32730_c0_g1_i1:135-746(+)
MGSNALAQMQLIYVIMIGAWGLMGVAMAVTLVPSRWPHVMQLVLTSLFFSLICVGYTATEHKSLARCKLCFWGMGVVEFVAVIFTTLTVVLMDTSNGGVFGGPGTDDPAASGSGSGSSEIGYRDYSNTVLTNTQFVNVVFGGVSTVAAYRGKRYLEQQAALVADPHGHGHGANAVGGHMEHAVRVPNEEIPAPSDQTILFQKL